MELYGTVEKPLTNVAVRMEIASEGSETALHQEEAAIVRQGEQLATARAVLPVGTLRPGRYVARAVITQGGGAPIRLERPFVVIR